MEATTHRSLIPVPLRSLLRSLGVIRSVPKLPATLVLVILITSIFAPLLTPHDPNVGNLAVQEKPPAFVKGGSSEYFLGTDRQGRDILSRLIVGTRVSMSIAVICIVLSVLVGTFLGLVAGYQGGYVDALVMRAVDAMLAFPSLLLALVLGVTVGPSFWVVVAVIGIVSWTRYARLIRGEVLALKQQDFVALARIAGCSPMRIILVHILPNVANSIVVLATLQVGGVIITEASLSFLGVGVPAETPSWGRMLDEGRSFLETSWWMSVFPGIAIMTVVLSFNIFGDWMRDVLDPKLRTL